MSTSDGHSASTPGSTPETPRSPAEDDARAVFEMDTLERGAELQDVLRSLFGDGAGATIGPTKLGRYEVRRRIGIGGMGSVYEAFDPNLDRRVAVKVLHADVPNQERLVAEGKAMARLSHPNVVTVHDVDMADGHAFVAMEYVQGVTLRRWQEQKRRSLREVIAMYRAFGEGIIAAHASGLVHCDLKPENVLVGDDGRPRVTDFGISRLGHDPTAPTEGQEGTAERLHAGLTQTGSIMGTPHYMSPEQYNGEALDARADQFGYCVMLWEALFGERPFRGKTMLELGMHISRGEIAPPPRTRSVPPWLRKICERGLRPEADERWASMEVLVAELARGAGRARRRFVLGSAVVAGVVAVGVWGANRAERNRAIARCDAQGRRIAEIWNSDVAHDVVDAISAIEVPYAATAAERVGPMLDAEAGAWSAARTEACRAHDVDATWSEQVYERAVWCLDDHHQAMAQRVAQLRTADRETVANAITIAAHQSNPQRCLDDRRLVFMRVPEVGSREEIRRVQLALQHVTAASLAGRYAEALELAPPIVDRARELQWPPLTSKALRTLSQAQLNRGEEEAAYNHALPAFFVALEHGAPQQALEAALSLLQLETRTNRVARARVWQRHVEVLLGQLQLWGSAWEAEYHELLGFGFEGRSMHDDAQREHRRARDLFVSANGAAHPAVARSTSNLADVIGAAGDFETAIPLHREVLRREIEDLGPHHPRVVGRYTGLAKTLALAGKPTEAAEHVLRAIAIREEAEGPTSSNLAGDLMTLGGLYETLEQPAKARGLNERALAILDQKPDANPALVASALNNLANSLKADGDWRAAEPHLTRALKLLQDSNADGYTIAVVMYNLADILRSAGEFGRARELLQESLRIREGLFGAEHPRLVPAVVGLAKLERDAGRVDAALVAAERALALATNDNGSPKFYRHAAISLADLLWDEKIDRARAVDVATEALAHLGSLGSDGVVYLVDVEAWLQAHPQ